MDTANFVVFEVKGQTDSTASGASIFKVTGGKSTATTAVAKVNLDGEAGREEVARGKGLDRERSGGGRDHALGGSVVPSGRL